MPRYMKTAAEANKTAKSLYELVQSLLPQDANKIDSNSRTMGEVTVHIAHLVNYGLRCAPRAVQSTVRLNAVRRAVEGLPVEVSIETVTNETTGYTFKALRVVPLSWV